MTTSEKPAFINARGGAAGAGLARLRMGDDIFSTRPNAAGGACAGFIIIQRGNFMPLPRPRAPLRPAGHPPG